MATRKSTSKKKARPKMTPRKAVVKRTVKGPAKKTASKSAASTRKAKPRAAVVKAPVARKPVSRAAAVKTSAERPATAAQPAVTPTVRAIDPNRYHPSSVEQKWQERWEQDGLYRTDFHDTHKPNFYFLTMYPYPSGDLHIGHWYAMAPSDAAAARYRRMKGNNVFFPMGFDAFGLPAENAAIKRGIHPYKWTMKNIDNMRRQLRSMGAMFDWSREVVTCMPDYYRWNQWFFLQFFKAGLAYKKMAPVDWCPKDQTVLAREQVIGPERLCERCDTPVIKKDLEQWFFRITKYADELLDFSKMQWPERVQTMQTNWIGRSEGAEIVFSTVDAYGGKPAGGSSPDSRTAVPAAGGREPAGESILCFSTRPDTLYGATFIVLAPEHPLVEKLTAPERKAEVERYVFEARRKTEIDREASDKDKTGLFIGAYAENPLNGAHIPIWIADYVLMGYGTGAIMGVPAHDARDWEFAVKFGLPSLTVIAPPGWNGQPLSEVYTGDGPMVNSGEFDGTPSAEGKRAVAHKLEALGAGSPRSPIASVTG